ncbi:2-hydroxyacid dehydrogenase [Pararcticibacter amylolyticus]|uniref:2-hydroxyacid dehydrogenase n=1 Tax=Pararcticibacter amylolyticus TaxID=2173175 RepID=UPI003742C2FF
MAQKIFITRKITASGVKLMEDAGFSVTEWTEKRDLTQEELIGHCKNYDALVSAGPNKLDKHFLNECRHLKVIALHAVGFDNVDVAEATRLGILVGNTPGVLSKTTADTAFLLMLNVSRKAFYHHQRILNGEWGFFDPTVNLGIELDGKTLGIFGLGNIGTEMAKRCSRAFGMKVIYHNRSRNEEAEKELGAEYVSFDELLDRSDILSVHSSLNKENGAIFNRDVFAKMKSTAIFINTARGAMHDEEALIEALRNGIIWGAGLDVSNPEPMLPHNPLLTMENVAVTPHIGTSTEETRVEMVRLIAENIIAGLKGQSLPYPVNPEVYKADTSEKQH